MPFGAIAGMVFLDNVALGAGLGLAVGLAIATGFRRDSKKTDDENPEGTDQSGS
ncbi:hypothetical protein [Nesterenkonia sandarakina]|uniref:Uncharacterized protein n=1 Tax=Nesterenkonia sandarakina TaxID=272918 RepID=A0A2T0YT66_9MICC|nr:hypothetical protein [Nesterenkonia sandarakina]PRZ18979.1 hypothetical protein BCL67_101290 [Nesterenkonia sandarakina]